MEKERLFVPRGSKLYYAAVIIAVAALIVRYVLNTLTVGAPIYELSPQPPMPIKDLEAHVPFFGFVRIIADICLPIGMILAFRKPSHIFWSYIGNILLVSAVFVCIIVQISSSYYPFGLMAIIGLAAASGATAPMFFITVVQLGISVLFYLLIAKGKIPNTVPLAISSAVLWMIKPLIYYILYRPSLQELPLNEWIFTAVEATSLLLFYLSLHKAPESVIANFQPYLRSEKGRLYVPKTSPMYVTAVVLSIAAVAVKLLYNMTAHGAPEYEFIFGNDSNRHMVLGVLHIISDLTIPLGFILCTKKLWRASFGILFSTGYLLIALLVNWFATAENILIALIVIPFVLLTDPTLYMLLLACCCPFAYNCKHMKSIAVYVPPMCWFTLALGTHFYYSVFCEVKIQPTFLGAIAYFLPATAALVLGISLKNAPAEQPADPPQPSVQTP